MKTSLRLVCVLSFLMATAVLSSAEKEFLKAFPETSGVRSLIASRWLTAPVAAVSPLQDEVVTDAYGESARISVTGRGKSLSVTLNPVGYSGETLRGRWVFLRDAATGDPLSIEIFPLEDSAISVVLRPGSESKTLLDLRIYGRDLRRGVPFGSAFQSLLTAPFSLVVSLTERTVPWELLSPDPLRYEGISKAVETIRSRLDRLVYLDDGAFNAEGRPVLISSGLDQNPKAVLEAAGTGRDLSRIQGGVNCAGFAKWIVDGMVRPEAGSGIRLKTLTRPSLAPETGFTERYRDSRLMFFGLDWVRNLAAASVSLSLGRTVYPEEAGVDVTAEPFPSETGYESNVGYRVSELIPLLYWLAVKEPGRWYLGALSEERGESGNPDNPLLRYYHHVAALFPWFDESGRFSLAVFESAAETDPEAFVLRDASEWIFLVRMDMTSPSRFDP